MAVARWPSDGQPPNPGAWIVNRAVDRLRRESVRDERHAQAHHLYGDYRVLYEVEADVVTIVRVDKVR